MPSNDCTGSKTACSWAKGWAQCSSADLAMDHGVPNLETFKTLYMIKLDALQSALPLIGSARLGERASTRHDGMRSGYSKLLGAG